MESLGQELQHAVEVLGARREAVRVHYFFQRHADAYRIGGRFETRVALQAGIAVSGEVARARRRRGVVAGQTTVSACR